MDDPVRRQKCDISNDKYVECVHFSRCVWIKFHGPRVETKPLKPAIQRTLNKDFEQLSNHN